MNDIKCDICKKCFDTEEQLFLHWSKNSKCIKEKNLNPMDIKIKYIESTRNIQFSNLCKEYELCNMSLKEISRNINVSYNLTKKIFLYLGIKLRDVKDSIRISNEKLKKYFYEKYGYSSFGAIGNLPKNREKAKKTSLANYGVQHPSSSKEIRNKVKETVQKRYGVDNVFQDKNIKEKIKETHLKNLGVEYPTQNYSIIQKIKENNFLKYGVDWYAKTEEYKEKYKKTMMRLYGVENIFCLENIKKYIDSIRESSMEKRRKTNEENGLWVKRENKTPFELYHSEVTNITKKFKKELFNNWNGNCFYTGQKLVSIKEYKMLNPNMHINTNRLQPTIDHKISILYGFLNNIDAKIIGGIDNLCVCARYINSVKNRLTNFEFENILKEIIKNNYESIKN